jgi:hypothetical protein
MSSRFSGLYRGLNEQALPIFDLLSQQILRSQKERAGVRATGMRLLDTICDDLRYPLKNRATSPNERPRSDRLNSRPDSYDSIR